MVRDMLLLCIYFLLIEPPGDILESFSFISFIFLFLYDMCLGKGSDQLFVYRGVYIYSVSQSADLNPFPGTAGTLTSLTGQGTRPRPVLKTK